MRRGRYETLHPTPYTLHSTPYTLHRTLNHLMIKRVIDGQTCMCRYDLTLVDVDAFDEDDLALEAPSRPFITPGPNGVSFLIKFS